MIREVTYEFSPELAKLAMRRFLSRHIGYRPIGLLIIFFLGFVYGFYIGWDVFSWLLIGMSGSYFLILARYLLGSTNALHDLKREQVKLTVSDDTIVFETNEHSSKTKWTLIKQAWLFPDFLLLFYYGKWNYVAIPTAPLGDELQRYIEDRIKQAGGTVRVR